MKLPKIGDLVLVVWRDAAGQAGWATSPTKLHLSKNEDVGWVIHRGKRRIVLAASRGLDTKNHGNRSAIPIDNIISWVLK